MPRRRPTELGTTAYAILGLLAVEPGTAYELAKRMERNYHFYWPRAESKLYEAVKTLVEAGFASVTQGFTGKRPRSVYRITAAGRQALANWVERPGAGPLLSFEGLLKLTYADFGSKRAALAQLRAIGDEASRTIELGEALGRAYAEGKVDHVERTPTNTLVWKFLWAHFHAVRDWARSAEREVERWSSTSPNDRNMRAARRALRAALASAARERKRRSYPFAAKT